MFCNESTLAREEIVARKRLGVRLISAMRREALSPEVMRDSSGSNWVSGQGGGVWRCTCTLDPALVKSVIPERRMQMELEQLKQKYAGALEAVQQNNVRLDHLHVQDNKLVMQGAAPNEACKNRVWNAIKAADPTLGDIACDLTIDASLPAPAEAPAAQKYTVQPGDSLSKIAKQFYGDSNAYMKIFEANTDQLDDPNKIQVGQELAIPAA